VAKKGKKAKRAKKERRAKNNYEIGLKLFYRKHLPWYPSTHFNLLDKVFLGYDCSGLRYLILFCLFLIISIH
jgi:hypothetical protein